MQIYFDKDRIIFDEDDSIDFKDVPIVKHITAEELGIHDAEQGELDLSEVTPDMTFDEIKHFVIEKDFGREKHGSYEGEPLFYSMGVLAALKSGSIKQREVDDALKRFCVDDFNGFYEPPEKYDLGAEYGLYPSSLSEGKYNDPADIRVHRENRTLVVYFDFER